MNCQNCGMNVDGNACCPRCGVPISNPVKYDYNHNRPMVRQGNPTNVLVFGIIGLALSTMGVVGLIFSIIALKKANNYIATYGDIANQVRIGRRLAIAGLIVSIFFTVLYIIMIIAAIIAAGNANTGTVRYSYS